MKTLKQGLCLILAIFTVCSLCACGEESNGNSNGISDAFAKEEGVSTKQLECDLAELAYIKNGILHNNPAGEYQVNEITVDKRQTNIEQKNDIIYCYVNISNDLYESDVYIKLTYNLYNGDMWSLDEDEYIREKCTSKPSRCFVLSEYPETFEKISSWYFDLENIQHINADILEPCDVDDYTYRQLSSYKTILGDGITGHDFYIYYYFSPSNGWTLTRDYRITDKWYVVKPDKVFGNFKKTYNDGVTHEYLSFYNYNANDNTVSYTYTDSSNRTSTGTATVDAGNMSVTNVQHPAGGNWVSDGMCTFYYSFEYNVWSLNRVLWDSKYAFKRVG